MEKKKSTFRHKHPVNLYYPEYLCSLTSVCCLHAEALDGSGKSWSDCVNMNADLKYSLGTSLGWFRKILVRLCKCES